MDNVLNFQTFSSPDKEDADYAFKNLEEYLEALEEMEIFSAETIKKVRLVLPKLRNLNPHYIKVVRSEIVQPENDLPSLAKEEKELWLRNIRSFVNSRSLVANFNLREIDYEFKNKVSKDALTSGEVLFIGPQKAVYEKSDEQAQNLFWIIMRMFRIQEDETYRQAVESLSLDTPTFDQGPTPLNSHGKMKRRKRHNPLARLEAIMDENERALEAPYSIQEIDYDALTDYEEKLGGFSLTSLWEKFKALFRSF